MSRLGGCRLRQRLDQPLDVPSDVGDDSRARAGLGDGLADQRCAAGVDGAVGVPAFDEVGEAGGQFGGADGPVLRA